MWPRFSSSSHVSLLMPSYPPSLLCLKCTICQGCFAGWTPTPETTPRRPSIWLQHGAGRTWSLFEGFPEIEQHSVGLVNDFWKLHLSGIAWVVSLHTRRCDKLLFMSTVADETIGSIALPNITNGRASLWNKTKKVQWGMFDISVASPHYPRHLFMCGSTTETRQTGSSKLTTTLMSSWKTWSENFRVFLSQQCLFPGISLETTTVKCQSNLDTDSNT